MTTSSHVPLHVPTLTEVVTWSDSATPAPWKRPTTESPDLAREVEARVMHHIQQLLPGLVEQALKETLQNANTQQTDN